MNYARHSSQPATVDLVRADLAEMWTIDGLEQHSPERLGSVSAASDMLDLEYLPTPKHPRSNAAKRDPLADMLADVLDQTPSQKEVQQEKAIFSHKLSELGGEGASPNDLLPTRDLGATTSLTNRVSSDDSLRPSDPERSSPSPPKPLRSNATKRSRPGRQRSPARPIGDSALPKARRRQRQAVNKSTVSAAAARNPIMVPQSNKHVEERNNPHSAQPKPHTKNRRIDVFELSDSTDTDESPKPKKRQAVQPTTAKKPAPPGKRTRAMNDVGSSHVNRKGKTSARVPKKPSSRRALRRAEVEAEPHPDTQVHPTENIDMILNQLIDDNTSAIVKSSSDKGTQSVGSASDVHDSIVPNDPPSLVPADCMPAGHKPVPIFSTLPKSHEDITPPKKNRREADTASVSTSPPFVEQAEEEMVDLNHLRTVNRELDTNPRRVTSPPKKNTDQTFENSPCYQPAAVAKDEYVLRQRSDNHELPTDIRDAFLSDEQMATSESPPTPLEKPCAEDAIQTSPERVWRLAVDDDAPPAVLHRIVTLLHRSLKPREEVVRDIATEYQENAVRLVDNLRRRHAQERTDTLTALRIASRGAASAFSDASSNMAVLMGQLRDMDITRTDEALTRSSLSKKLGAAVQVCQEKLGAYSQRNTFPDSRISEDVPGSEEEGKDEAPDTLAESFHAKLSEVVHQVDPQHAEEYEKADEAADAFIQRSVRSEPSLAHSAATERPHKAAQTAGDALEVLLDKIIGEPQNNPNKPTPSGNVIELLSEDMGMSDLGSEL